jgi:adenine phosphoribosyltransferase
MPVGDLRNRLLANYRSAKGYYDPSCWWLDAVLLRETVIALAELHPSDEISVVIGIEARGYLLGPLVAQHLEVGFVEVSKDLHPNDIGEALLRRTTPPDYNDRGLTLAMRRHVLNPRDRVLLVDDWIATGAQATAARSLVEDAGAAWVGAAVIVDDMPAARRRDLNVRSLLRAAELPD